MTPLEPTLSKIPNERKPRHCLAPLGNTKKKNVPCFSDLRATDFSSKRKEHFFWCSALQVFGQCGGASMRTRFCQNYFLGERIWQNLG